MKWIRTCSAAIAMLSLTTIAQAGLFGGHGSGKSYGCASSDQPRCCAPTIKRPCCPTVHTYQRKISNIKPPCCNTRSAPKSCCPKHRSAKRLCNAPRPVRCAAPVAVKHCAPAPANCAAPRKSWIRKIWSHRSFGHKGCTAHKNCAAPRGCTAHKNCAAPRGCTAHKGCTQKSCAQKNCCNADPCAIAKLIYTSQTACYAKDRRRAIDDLGDYDCQCNPEIMVAMIYALNDAVEGVRKEAADEIGDQLRKNPSCCSKTVIAALTAALGDCDSGVRHQAEEGLVACGYEVVDGCCDGVNCDPCTKKCGSCAVPGTVPGTVPTPMPKGKSTAPPAPGTEKVHFPVTLRRLRSLRSNRLAKLFSMFD